MRVYYVVRQQDCFKKRKLVAMITWQSWRQQERARLFKTRKEALSLKPEFSIKKAIWCKFHGADLHFQNFEATKGVVRVRGGSPSKENGEMPLECSDSSNARDFRPIFSWSQPPLEGSSGYSSDDNGMGFACRRTEKIVAWVMRALFEEALIPNLEALLEWVLLGWAFDFSEGYADEKEGV